MKRTELINAIISKRSYQTYLEIGAGGIQSNFAHIRCPYRIGIDPNPASAFGENYTCDSDAFFKANRERYDLIFIDGLHEEGYVDRDIANSLAALNPGGVIVLHDCLPTNEWEQRPVSYYKPGESWHGTVWKSAYRYFATSPFECCVVDADCGCGIIDTARRRTAVAIEPLPNRPLSYKEDFSDFVTRWTISADQFIQNLEGFQPFYSVGCQNHWKEIVVEQLTQYKQSEIDLEEIRVGLNGSHDDARWLEDLANGLGLRLRILRQSPHLGLFETSALHLIQEWANNERVGENGKCLYFHTKGTTAPGDRNKERWRKFMAKHVIEGWRDCIKDLDDHDLVGADWRDIKSISHFAGNFWWARVDWLRKLSDFAKYYEFPWYKKGFDHPYRQGCEFWISSCNEVPRVKSLGCRNTNIWTSDWLEHIEI